MSIVRAIPRTATKCLGVALFAGAVVAASGGSAGATTKRIDFLAAYRATIAANSAKEALSEVVVAGGTRQTVSGSGVTDSQGDGSFTLQAAGQTIDTVIDNGILYLKAPPTSMAALNVATPWISLNLNALTKAKLGQSYQQLVSDGQQGPAQSLAILQNASSSRVKTVGTATLFGANTTEYRAAVDLNKLASASGRPALAPAIKNLESKYHVSSIPVQVWLDSQQRVRRLVEIVKVPSSNTTPAVSATITVNIEAFDVPVTVAPPPAGQVTDITAKATESSPE
jgi:hypothetical protein